MGAGKKRMYVKENGVNSEKVGLEWNSERREAEGRSGGKPCNS
jgi:hypothetical protein